MYKKLVIDIVNLPEDRAKKLMQILKEYNMIYYRDSLSTIYIEPFVVFVPYAKGYGKEIEKKINDILKGRYKDAAN